MPNGSNKSYAMIDGVLQEYDVALSSLAYTRKIDHNIYMYLDIKYEYLGGGYIDSVCGVPNYSKKLMYFFAKKKVEKKKYGW